MYGMHGNALTDVRMACMCTVFGVGGEISLSLFVFLCFYLEMSIFALMFLGNDIVQLHINLCVFGSYVREKGESVRTRKGWWDNKL